MMFTGSSCTTRSAGGWQPNAQICRPWSLIGAHTLIGKEPRVLYCIWAVLVTGNKRFIRCVEEYRMSQAARPDMRRWKLDDELPEPEYNPESIDVTNEVLQAMPRRNPALWNYLGDRPANLLLARRTLDQEPLPLELTYDYE
ncbi:hypothetical protein J6590_045409 [Homalodisca vitripennis]|nr:hypothetical protein J6590_045409 [Homalodisca vitripennis]